MSHTSRKLSPAHIEKKMQSISDWVVNKNMTQLSKVFPITSYLDGLAFLARIVVYAEVMQHHPDIELSYRQVKVRLTTHDAKGLTLADFELAKKIERIASK